VSSRDRYVFYRDLNLDYIPITRAEGVYMWDDRGRRYLDGCAGALVVNVGHSRPEVAEAIAEQVGRVAFTHLSRFANEPLLELAAEIAAMTPGDLNRCYFVSGGSEGTETAVKLVRQYWLEKDRPSKHKVIARQGSFHGNTLGALSMTGHLPRRAKYLPLLLEFPHIAPAYCYHCPFGAEHPDCGLRCAHELEREIEAQGAGTVAAFIAEPIVGAAAGALVPPPEYFPIVREICDRHEVLLICDEVMCGFGRTGENFGIDHWSVVPDVLVSSKGLGGGYSPLGVVVATDEVHDAIQQGSGRFVHGHTYGGNPVSCAAGLAVLRIVKRENLVQRARENGTYLRQRMEGLRRYPAVGDVRGLGLMQAIELVRDRQTRESLDKGLEAAQVVSENILRHGGVRVYPGNGGYNGAGDHILVGPPLCITREEIDELVDGLDRGIAASLSRLGF